MALGVLAAAISAEIGRGVPLPGVPAVLWTILHGSLNGLVVHLSQSRAVVLTREWSHEGRLTITLFGVEPTKRIRVRAHVKDIVEVAGVALLSLDLATVTRDNFDELDQLANFVAQLAETVPGRFDRLPIDNTRSQLQPVSRRNRVAVR